MSNLNWPDGSTHKDQSWCGLYYKFDFEKNTAAYWNGAKWCKSGTAPSYQDGSMDNMISRPAKPWSGPEDGLPPVGSIVIARLSDTNKWHESEVLRHNTQYQRNGVCAFMEVKSNMMFWSNEYKAIKTPEQLAAEKRETAIREFMDVVGIDCRVTASKAVDAGFKREVA